MRQMVGKQSRSRHQSNTQKQGQGPYPAVIANGGPSNPVPSSVATISLNNDLIAQQNTNASRGIGLFYDLYGVNATASAMTAWSWAISRIIDTLETMLEANINTTCLAITGCSRNGKGALVAGALDERIALMIPQESGSGGDACWRLSDVEQAAGYVVQTSAEIVRENVLFALSFDEFALFLYFRGKGFHTEQLVEDVVHTLVLHLVARSHPLAASHSEMKCGETMPGPLSSLDVLLCWHSFLEIRCRFPFIKKEGGKDYDASLAQHR
jgi:hypothetical protein